MKLILENWKRFIFEVSQQEQSYFGKTIQIANQIVNELDEWKATLEDKTNFGVKTKIQDFVKILKQKIPNLNFHGIGMFRAVFSTDEDVVIKIDYTNGNLAKDQNEKDAQMGRLAQDPKFSYLFPRSFLSDDNSRWVILERVTPLGDNPTKFNEFFNTPKIDEITTNPKLKALYIRACLLHDTQGTLSSSFKSLIASINTIKSQEENEDKTPIKELVVDLRKFNLFTDLVRVCKQYKISPWEIRPDNVGVTYDNRFVIIDPSTVEQNNAALKAQGVTVPLKK
jgi:hypothetical protein